MILDECVLIAAIALCCGAANGEGTSVYGLRTDRLVEPAHLGASPVFSWKIAADRRGARQCAYRVRVADETGRTFWDSGEVDGQETLAIPYRGEVLTECSRYRWRVEVRDETGAWTKSDDATFMTGFLRDDFWKGSEWITPVETNDCKTAVFRKSVVTTKVIREAFWCLTGLGVFEAQVNGQRVGRDVLKPGFTEAEKCRHAFTYDVTSLLDVRAGATNVLSSSVSCGWWCDDLRGEKGANKGQKRFFPTVPGFRAQLVVRYGDGSEDRFGTGTDWEAAYSGPVIRAGIWEGEFYDARRMPGGWMLAKIDREFTGEIRNFIGPTVVHREDLAMKPMAAYVVRGVAGASDGRFGDAMVVRRYADGEPMSLNAEEMLVMDFGQNAAAVPDFIVEGSEGTVLSVRHAEMLNEPGGDKLRGNDGPGGTPYFANLRSSSACVEYTLKEGRQEYRPLHSYFGYRYVSVVASGPVKILSFRSVPISSVHSEDETGVVETTDPAVNRLIANVRWGQLSNYLSVPTDCPQRDERLGWTGDTQAFAATATRNAEVYGFLRKWLADLRDGQMANGAYCCVAPDGRNKHVGAMAGWCDAGVIVPYILWTRYGDLSAVEDGWESMRRYMDHLDRNEGPDRHNFGDWLAYEHQCAGRDVHNQPLEYKKCLSAFYWIWDAMMMREMAEALGRSADATHYRETEKRARDLYRKKYRNGSGVIREDFRGQTTSLFQLRLGLCPDVWSKLAVQHNLEQDIRAHGDCLQTGFLGTSILLDTLGEEGEMPEVAWTLLLQRKDPSWLYSVDQGATTIWERWNSYTKANGFGPVAMNSFNHYAYGSVLEWIYAGAAGIRPDVKAPGYRHFILKPRPDRRMGGVTARFESPVGSIESAWRFEGDVWRWRFTIPANASATVIMPRGMPVEYGSGTYEIVTSSDFSARFRKLPYGNPAVHPFLKVGLWAWPVVMDYDGDGDKDLLVSCPGGPSNGLYFFENRSEGKETMPVFSAGRRLDVGRSGASMAAPSGKYASLVTVPGFLFPDFTNSAFASAIPFRGLPTNIHTNAVRGAVWRLADLDGDGWEDLLVGVGDWKTYGWADLWDANGKWTKGEISGLVYFIRNRGGAVATAEWERPVLLRHPDGSLLKTNGSPIPMAADWDGDGDIDLLCGEFIDGFFFFENVGTATSPRWAPRRTVKTDTGDDLKMELAMITPSAVDWDGDGDLDVICGDEDGRIAFIENVGRGDDGTPRFRPPQYFRQEAADLNCGVLVTPWCVDFDGDGDLDIVCGDSAGYVNFIENLSGKGVALPSWGEPVHLRAAGEIIRIQAGENGSIQGPCERKWGYTTLSVADWDGDGRQDVIVNSIWGDVIWYRNVGTGGMPALAAPENVEVEWDGEQPELKWGWYKPRHKRNPKGLLTQWRTTPVAIDWDGDGLVDLVMLDHEGYLALFRRDFRDGRRILLPPVRVFADENGHPLRLANMRSHAGATGRRKLCFADWDGDGRMDLFVNSKNAVLYQQVGEKDGRWLFKKIGDVSDVSLNGHSTSPCAVDFDGDGVSDLLIGAEDGFFYHVPNPRTVDREERK